MGFVLEGISYTIMIVFVRALQGDITCTVSKSRFTHTRAKSRDYGIVRAQKKVSKCRPNHLQNHVVCSRTFKSSNCEAICDHTLNQMLFQ